MIIDTDPGIDDAMAIAYAHAAPEIDLLGLTTTFGNTFVGQSSRNARYLLHRLGVSLPVAQGAGQGWDADGHMPSHHVHGPEGFGDLTEIPEIGENHAEPAAEFLVRQAKEHKGELVVCAIGPLTNIADAIRLDPGFAGNLKRLVIMGGAVYCPGNITPAAEANIHHDPAAADVVMANGLPMTIVGLDVTLKLLMDRRQLDDLAARAPDIGGFLHQITQFYIEFYQSVAGLDGCGLHDSTAVIACTHPHLFETVETGIAVTLDGAEAGATRPDPGRSNVSVCTGLQSTEVMRLFTDRICSLG